MDKYIEISSRNLDGLDEFHIAALETLIETGFTESEVKKYIIESKLGYRPNLN